MKSKSWLSMVVFAVVLAGGWALANEEAGEHHAAQAEHAASEAGGHHQTAGHAEDVPTYILHHVGDSDEFEFDLPYPGASFTIPIGHWFSFLVFETVPGACKREVPAGMAAFPGMFEASGGCWDLRPTKAVLMMWVAFAVLLVVLTVGRKRDQNGVPHGFFTNFVEALALFVRDEIVVANIGKAEAARYTPYFMSLFFFVLFTNWLGLIPGFFTGTGVIAVTAALAVITFCLTQLAGIRSAGLGGYLSHLTGGVPKWMWPLMIPVEMLGLFTKPFALLVRLFANMVGGHMVIFFLLALIFVWHPGAAAISVPLAIGIYCLEIFVGILQAYLFTLLSALFVGQGVAMGHHHHDEAHAGHADKH